MKFIYFLSLLYFGESCSVQSKCVVIFKGNEKSKFVDSIRNAILLDTAKFDPKDVIHLNGQIKNIKEYSPLFIVNEKFYYRLDILAPEVVALFTDKVLIDTVISEISYLDKNQGSLVWGSLANNGVVYIKLKKKIAFNPIIAGLKMFNHNGSNFEDTKESSLIIRH
jgi:hypothetical protein